MSEIWKPDIADGNCGFDILSPFCQYSETDDACNYSFRMR